MIHDCLVVMKEPNSERENVVFLNLAFPQKCMCSILKCFLNLHIHTIIYALSVGTGFVFFRKVLSSKLWTNKKGSADLVDPNTHTIIYALSVGTGFVFFRKVLSSKLWTKCSADLGDPNPFLHNMPVPILCMQCCVTIMFIFCVLGDLGGFLGVGL